MRHKGRELEKGRRERRGSQKEKERVIMGGGEAGRETEREEVWTMSSLLPRKQHKQSVKIREPSGAERGTAQGHAIIRHWMTRVLYRVKTRTGTNPHCKSICKLWVQDVEGKNKHCRFDWVCIFNCDIFWHQIGNNFNARRWFSFRDRHSTLCKTGSCMH